MNALSTRDDGQGEDQVIEIEVSDLGGSERLDAWLARQLPDHMSRTRIKSMIIDGHVKLNGNICEKPRQGLADGDIVSLELPEIEDPEPKAENIPLNILHEDQHLIVINKPAGMVVHPAPGHWSGTLVNGLIHHCGDSLQGIGGVRRPGIVHRLDRNTSGVMVVAKTQQAHAGLAAQFADHGRTGPLTRTYQSIVWGSPPRPSGKIDAPLGRAPNNRLKRAVVSPEAPDAREAITHYRVIDKFGTQNGSSKVGQAVSSLVECRLETGRTHQIRVHLAHIGNPLIGDQEYGRHFATKTNILPESARKEVEKFPRQALHAASLGFKHPATDETLKFDAPLPDDMEALKTALKQAFE
ncbi:MAG: RluA family pseudouridine synthase [Pseudomonadota bacterium]